MTRLNKAHTQSWASWIVITFLVMASIVAVSIAYFSFSKTTVTITPAPRPFTAQVEVALNQVSGAVITSEQTGDFNYTDITSQTETPDYATGTMTLKNETGAAQTLVATTRLLSDAGVLFRTQDKTVVPAHGQIDVTVKADQPGADGNATPTHFTIVALHPGQQAKIYGVNAQTFTGGLKKTGVLTAADLKKANAQLKNDLIKTGIADLHTQAEAAGGTSDYITADSVIIEQEESTQSAQAGDTVNEVKVHLKLKISAITFDQTQLETLVTEQVKLQAPQGSEVAEVPGYKSYTYTLLTTQTPPDDPIKVVVTVKASSVIKLSSPLLDRSKIVNQDEQEIKTYFSNFEEVKDVQVTFRPFWIKRAPALVDHIVIQIAQPSSEQL